MRSPSWLAAQAPFAVRLGLLALLLGSALVLHQLGSLPFSFPGPLLFSLAYLAATLGLSSLRARRERWQLDYGQMVADVAWIFLFLRAAGGADSPFALLFFVAIIEAAYARFVRGALFTATIASLAYAGILLLDYRSLGQAAPQAEQLAAAFGTEYFFRGYIYAICFYLVATLAGILAERVRLKGKQLEAAAKGWEEFRLSTGDILQKMGSGLLTLNGQGQIRYCNRTGAEILGLDERRITGSQLDQAFSGGTATLGEILHDILTSGDDGPIEEDAPGHQRAAKRRLSDIRHEIVIIRDDGSEVPLGISTTTVKDADGKFQGIIAIFQNLTEAKRIESRLLQAEQLESLSEHIKILFQMIQPALASIDGAIAKLGGAEADRTAVPKEVDTKVVLIRKIIDDFMRYAKIEIPRERREDPASTGGREKRIVGESPQFLKTLELVQQVAPTDSTVLIYGESGTGKELLAREIHRLSRRSHGPFVSINCAALPETLLESELFGHVRGSFTGAVRDKDGLFRVADGGTFFLDEVSETSPAIQVKLLRVLQEREIVPVGGTKPIKVDVRLVSATNTDLLRNVETGKFRRDLYYRLNVIKIDIPALRERSEDIVPLADHFLEWYCARNSVPLKRLTPEVKKILQGYRWPGNVRELENTLERSVVLAPGLIIEPTHLPESIQDRKHGLPTEGQRAAVRGGSLKDEEREIIIKVIEECRGNKSLAAKRLGIHYTTLYRKMKQYKLN